MMFVRRGTIVGVVAAAMSDHCLAGFPQAVFALPKAVQAVSEQPRAAVGRQRQDGERATESTLGKYAVHGRAN